ncbi:FHA domain-containing protein [Spirosoma montaniterrae]|nr:FHA domain-containing protein [Spirosoma montaniterrae]
MPGFKTSLISCQQCGRRIMVRGTDAERGYIVCSHVGCGATNMLQSAFHYDESIVHGLPGFGCLTYLGQPRTLYPLRYGPNVIGTGDTANIRVDRYLHNGRCFISRQHCTLTVSFDKWTGQLRYQLQDGAADPDTQAIRHSLNGTSLNNVPLQKTDIIDVDHQGLITLGGADRFRLSHQPINPVMLETYKVDLAFNPDRTQ